MESNAIITDYSKLLLLLLVIVWTKVYARARTASLILNAEKNYLIYLSDNDIKESLTGRHAKCNLFALSLADAIRGMIKLEWWGCINPCDILAGITAEVLK